MHVVVVKWTTRQVWACALINSSSALADIVHVDMKSPPLTRNSVCAIHTYAPRRRTVTGVNITNSNIYNSGCIPSFLLIRTFKPPVACDAPLVIAAVLTKLVEHLMTHPCESQH
ncbi:hypothetical protein EDD22DRAFT_888407 [Suillus occidentalis]|nr:hypothetical protein EDD22DRAFT_888407 [Suillus occidentalis]